MLFHLLLYLMEHHNHLSLHFQQLRMFEEDLDTTGAESLEVEDDVISQLCPGAQLLQE